MMSLDWTVIGDRLIRYYYPVLVLLPVLLSLCFADKHMMKTRRNTLVTLCLMLLLLVLVDAIEEPLARLPKFTIWRLIFSVTGFSLRPACLLVVLLDSMPGAKQQRKIHLLLCLPACINAVAFCSAFICPLVIWFDAENFYHRGPLFGIVIVVSALYMLLLAYSAVNEVTRRNRRKGIAFLAITVACFAASIMEMLGIAYPTPLLNQTIAIGMTLYFLIQFMVASADTIENMQLSLLLMQIRPHFINNSLAAIRGMIRRDPEKAVDALNHFSGYLQDSMNSILKTNLIPLSQEMELIDNYLYMENTRFRDSITVVKELAPVDFHVPPLTVQPLVENAVRHGLRGIQTPGQLIIRTEIDSKEYRILVIDNGCGYDTIQPPDPRREHVGIKMCVPGWS